MIQFHITSCIHGGYSYVYVMSFSVLQVYLSCKHFLKSGPYKPSSVYSLVICLPTFGLHTPQDPSFFSILAIDRRAVSGVGGYICLWSKWTFSRGWGRRGGGGDHFLVRTKIKAGDKERGGHLEKPWEWERKVSFEPKYWKKNHITCSLCRGSIHLLEFII